MNVVLSVARYWIKTLDRWIGGSVLIEHARAGRPSMAMLGMRHRCRGPSRVSGAPGRKLFFPGEGGGGGSERGRGLAVRAVILLLRRKNGILIFGRW